MALAALGLLAFLFTRPCLYFRSGGETLLSFPTRSGDAFSIRFIHSVQKTPVVENLEIDAAESGFVLVSTQYQSFGVGLPFLLEEGDFTQEGDYFVFRNMKRKMPQLTLRTGVGTRLTILYKGAEYPVYRQLPAGSRIDLEIAPYYARFFSGTIGEKEGMK